MGARTHGSYAVTPVIHGRTGHPRSRRSSAIAPVFHDRAGITRTRGATHDPWGRTHTRTRANAGSARERGRHTTRTDAQHPRTPPTLPCNTTDAGKARTRGSYAIAPVITRTRQPYTHTHTHTRARSRGPPPHPRLRAAPTRRTHAPHPHAAPTRRTHRPHPHAAPLRRTRTRKPLAAAWYRYGSGSASLASLASMPVAVSRSTMSGRMSSTRTDSVSSDPGSTASGDNRRATSVRCSRAWS